MGTVADSQNSEKKIRQWPYYLLGAFLMYMAIASYKYFSAPHSYEECVMDNIKPGDSDTAAKIKSAACYKMFPKPSAFDVVERESRMSK